MGPKVAYILSRFPTIAETFILYEMLELKRLGLQIEIFPLIHQREPVKHAEVDLLAAQVHHHSLFSGATVAAHLYWLRKNPKIYGQVWRQTIRHTWKSLKFLSRSLVVLSLAALYARRMVELEIDHIHAHWATHPALAAYLIKQLTGIPYSFTAHANDIFVDQTMLEEKIRQASFVVTISQFNRQFLCKLYDELAAQKVFVIHCGVDPAVFQARPPKKLTHKFTIVCVARLEEKKGHRYLLEACAPLKSQGINFHCLLVGDGEARTEIEAHIRRLNLTDQITVLGFQPRHRVRELLAGADVMVLPSIVTGTGRQEGIPVALMEALAIGLPAIATAISGIPELIEDGETGLLVPERDPQALTRAIIKLYHSRELGPQLGAGGRDKVLKDFNLHTTTAALHQLFSSNSAPNPSLSPQGNRMPGCVDIS
jgi:glycosyltransferase involved in cell wall biosynthesis